MSGAGPRLGLPDLGDGVGLRDVHFRHLLDTPPEDWGVDWFEILTENFFDDHGLAAHVLDHVAGHRPVVMHGVGLSIAGTDPLDPVYLDKLRSLADRVHPAWISDHLCWTGVGGIVSHDLLPVPLTRHALSHVADRVRAVQDHLGRPLVLENPSTYLQFRGPQMPEWEFLGTLAEETGCGLLLDVNNVYVSAFNHGFDAVAYVEGLPADHVVQVHLAGHRRLGHYLLDTHDGPVPQGVWPLYALAQRRVGGVATLVEWDADIPPFATLVEVLARARAARDGPQPGGGPPAAAARPGTTETRTANPSAAASDLGAVQRWMVAACTGTRPADAAAMVQGTVRLPAADRVGIYARGYVARLLGCLRSEYPVLRATVGDQVFDLFGRAYLGAHPPGSASLFDVGAGFAAFLERTRPTPATPPDSPDALPAVLARLERARFESAHAAGVETETGSVGVDALQLMAMAHELTVRTPDSLRLLRLPFDLTGTLAAVERGEHPALPPAADTRYAVARSAYWVRTHALAPWQHAFLEACGSGGTGLASAVRATGEATGLAPEVIWAALLTWLPAAADLGMVMLAPRPA